MEKKTFHQANIEALKKIGITNIYNVFCKGVVKDIVKRHFKNCTNVSFTNCDDIHSILHLEFGDVVDNFTITWEKTERGTYNTTSIE